jgi:hypothetical protein
MKILIVSRDIAVLQPLVKRLVAAGIPFVFCKAPDMPSYWEVWIKNEVEASRAGSRLPIEAASRPLSGQFATAGATDN